MKFTALLHHVTVDLLRDSYGSLRKQAAPGVDGGIWEEYGRDPEVRLTDLHERVHRGAYRTPQGGVISPLDDAGVHCRTQPQAEEVRAAMARRIEECRLELHPEKTKIVYCKDDDRRGTYPNEKFDFLGYTFRPRRSKSRKGKFFINFSPAVSDQAGKEIRAEISKLETAFAQGNTLGGAHFPA